MYYLLTQKTKLSLLHFIVITKL